ncbi:MAG TPA: crossover junction endodeoxyribonuclease RuvC [Patescibacteria group bacterium]|nr:crossover junction endodeoxyribonuclease RuvC [Patescibacteria group bacterium]
MIILGIDPGIARMGWGVVSSENNKMTAVAYDCFTTEKETAEEIRLAQIFESMSELIATYKPEVVSVEKLFFASNAKTALLVGQARGAILLACGRKKIPVRSFTPLEVKMALTSYGRADKGQVQRMVQSTLGLSKIPQPDDIADALAIAITCGVMKSFL